MSQSRIGRASLPNSLAFLGIFCLITFPQDAPKGIETLPIPQPKASTPARRALLIGNRNYLGRPLSNSVRDANDLAEALRRSGFEAEVVTDANQTRIEDSVSSFIKHLGQGDLGLFFYSGHGFQLDSANYIVPLDFSAHSDKEARQKAVSFDSLKKRLETAGADGMIMILDACRDEPFTQAQARTHGLAYMEAGLGSYIAFATSPGKTAIENRTERNSRFTKYLLQELSDRVSVAELFRRVRRDVQNESNGEQIPYLHDQMIADFYLGTKPQTEPHIAELVSPTPDEDNAKRLYQEGRCQEAVELLDRTIRIRPSNAFTHNALGLAYACLKMNVAAAERFSMAIELKPDYAAPFINRGNVFTDAGQYALAIEDFTWAIQQEPSNASFYSRRGRAWLGLRRWEDAQTDFVKAVELDPYDAHGYYGLGRIAHQLGRYEDALRYYTAAISNKSDFSDAYLGRALTRERIGDSGGAANDRRAAVELRR